MYVVVCMYVCAHVCVCTLVCMCACGLVGVVKQSKLGLGSGKMSVLNLWLRMTLIVADFVY